MGDTRWLQQARLIHQHAILDNLIVEFIKVYNMGHLCLYGCSNPAFEHILQLAEIGIHLPPYA